jgi:putative nucleotidyltransferase with HDIG domain
MTDAVAFLMAMAQALSAMALYPEGHASRERAVETAYGKLSDLLGAEGVVFSYLGDEVLYNDQPVRELRDWEWSQKLASVGLQRVQFDDTVTTEELEEFFDLILSRVANRPTDTSEARQMRPSGIRYGAIGLQGLDADLGGHLETATIALHVAEEADAIRWLHDEISGGKDLPLAEAEAVVRALGVAMHGDQEIILPLLQIRRFDEYTTTHSMNVCVLSMALAEWLGMGARDVRSFGVAGLLHDLGKVKIPIEILTKPGKLTEDERRLMNQHPTEGARIIISSEPDLDLAAVVAYEHHIMLNGGGYPALRYERDCHTGSKLVHVCDVYDALRTRRPYRDAWPFKKVLSYLEERSGTEFDGQLVGAFTKMIRAWEPVTVTDREAAPTEDPSPPAS